MQVSASAEAANAAASSMVNRRVARAASTYVSIGAHVVDRQPRIERRDRRPDVRGERRRIPIGPHDVRHRASLPEPIGNEDLRREILDEAAQPEMPHDADDGHASIGRGLPE